MAGLNDVAMFEYGAFDVIAVEQGAVGAAQILNIGLFALCDDQCVAPADGEVIELYFIAVLATNGQGFFLYGVLIDDLAIEGQDQFSIHFGLLSMKLYILACM